jgi:uncharacterized protein (DUF488 family)
MAIQLFTIGFTQKTAEQFFELLRAHRVTLLVDTRLKPNSQLSGFARGQDLSYLLRGLIGADYRHIPAMSPTDSILSRYRCDHDWEAYEAAFNALLHTRQLAASLDKAWWAGQRACLLCSEHTPEQCHRRLVAEYLAAAWGDVDIHHLIE